MVEVNIKALSCLLKLFDIMTACTVKLIFKNANISINHYSLYRYGITATVMNN